MAVKEGRPPYYTLIYEPPDNKDDEQANGAKLIAFCRSILDRFDGHSEPLLAINTQLEKCMIGFFGDMLAAQFDGCLKRLQEYAMLSAVDKDAIKSLAQRIDTKVRERIRDRDPYSETIGAALTEEEVLKYLNLTHKDMKDYNWGNIMSLKAMIAHMYLNANRAVREIRLQLKNVVDEELERTAKSDLVGLSKERLLVHGFSVQAGGPGAQDKIRGKTARWELDGFMRHYRLELCVASKVADYMLLRFKELPLDPALESAETLLAFLDESFFLLHAEDKPPKAYSDHTMSNMLKGTGKSVGLEQKAGVEHVHGKLLHRIKHGAIRAHIDSLGNEDAARRFAHGGKVHEASYSNRTWCPKIMMAKLRRS